MQGGLCLVGLGFQLSWAAQSATDNGEELLLKYHQMLAVGLCALGLSMASCLASCSGVGKKLSTMTSRRVIVLTLIMLFCNLPARSSWGIANACHEVHEVQASHSWQSPWETGFFAEAPGFRGMPKGQEPWAAPILKAHSSLRNLRRNPHPMSNHDLPTTYRT